MHLMDCFKKQLHIQELYRQPQGVDIQEIKQHTVKLRSDLYLPQILCNLSSIPLNEWDRSMSHLKTKKYFYPRGNRISGQI